MKGFDTKHLIWVGVSLGATLFGGVDKSIQVLVLLMCVDILSGVFKALKIGGFTSKAFREGLMQKAGFFLVIILAYQIDVMIGQPSAPVRTATCLFYIAVEGSSIIENLGQLGVKIPSIIAKRLACLQEQEGNTKEENEEEKL